MKHLPFSKILRISALFIFLTGEVNDMLAQIVGKITDEKGIPLSYAAVYLEGTSTGTVSNSEGRYILEIAAEGEYQLAFQFVGYKQVSKKISYQGTTVVLDVILQPEEYVLDELVITDAKEDPAYPIMRKAISKREYYRQQARNFEADLYVKGVVKILETPEEILGRKIGNMGGILDSTRQGIIYLSESKSKFYCLSPEKTKEVMVSSIRSEGNGLFTANQFSWASFDLYNEYLSFSRTIVSPLADNAFSHYNFRLEGAILDERGKIVNKISIIPKSKNSPLLEGTLYIADDLWNIYSTELHLYGNVLKNTFLDTIHIKQVYVPVASPDTWKLFSQVFTFRAGLLNVKVGGNFTYIFSNYTSGVDVSKHFTDNETFRVEQNALNKDTAFWKETRPIPLTTEETMDYTRKDSLQKIWNSEVFRDSVDRENNKVKWLDLVSGYTYQKSRKNIQLSLPSPLSTIRFNALEGFKASLEAKWEKEDSLARKWTIQPGLDYGFSDKTVKPRLLVTHIYDNYNQGKITVAGGMHNQQFEPREPITERNNTWNSLWNKRNTIRMFRHHYFRVEFSREVLNGYYLTLRSGYSDRRPVSVMTQYSFRKKEEDYAENIPRADLNPDVYQARRFWKNQVSLLIRPGQTYSSYPNRKVRDISDWPNVYLDYEHGIPLDDQTSWYHKAVARIRDEYVSLRLAGYFSYNVEIGTRLSGNIQYFGDYFHPMGNELLSPIDLDMASFNLKPYYEYSTNEYYTQMNFRHHFNGLIFDRIPLINKTSLKLVVGGGVLHVPDKSIYSECYVGIENVRVGPLQILDVDYTWAFAGSQFRDKGITIRLSSIFKN